MPSQTADIRSESHEEEEHIPLICKPEHLSSCCTHERDQQLVDGRMIAHLSLHPPGGLFSLLSLQ
jgi:hypothetical protein